MNKIKRDDTVLVIKGKDRGRSGVVRKVIPSESQVMVVGVNVVKRHLKPRGTDKPGGIIQREAPVSWSNVAILCKNCNKPVRVGFRRLPDGRKIRYCKSCNANLD